jgi:hypothetical protein
MCGPQHSNHTSSFPLEVVLLSNALTHSPFHPAPPLPACVYVGPLAPRTPHRSVGEGSISGGGGQPGSPTRSGSWSTGHGTGGGSGGGGRPSRAPLSPLATGEAALSPGARGVGTPTGLGVAMTPGSRGAVTPHPLLVTLNDVSRRGLGEAGGGGGGSGPGTPTAGSPAYGVRF